MLIVCKTEQENLTENGQEMRRDQVKKNSVAMTKAMERPFSFYERDKNREKKYKEDYRIDHEPFKAHKVPWFCSIELYNEQR